MEKYGIEFDRDDSPLEKKASHRCEHPIEAREKDGDVQFCKKCQKYLPSKRG